MSDQAAVALFVIPMLAGSLGVYLLCRYGTK